MFRIGDFSRLSQVTIKALRHYDEIGLFAPARIDPGTGYRFYSASQLITLNRIRIFRDLGFSLPEIARLLEENTPLEQVRGMLRIKQAEALRAIEAEHARLARVEALIRQLDQEAIMPAYEITEKNIPAVTVASLRKVVPNYQAIGDMFETLCGFIARNNVRFAGPALTIYQECEYKESDIDIEVAVPVAGSIPPHETITSRELPAIPIAATTIHCGPYEDFTPAYNAIMQWVEANGYTVSGESREIYLRGPEPGRAPADYVTEIQVPVEKK